MMYILWPPTVCLYIQEDGYFSSNSTSYNNAFDASSTCFQIQIPPNILASWRLGSHQQGWLITVFAGTLQCFLSVNLPIGD